MASKTVRVVATGGKWAVRQEGRKRAPQTFSTKADAVEAAKTLARESQPSQLLIHDQQGRIQADQVFGLPKVQRSPHKGDLSASQIERAVLKVADGITD
jgi:hypothetical protein